MPPGALWQECRVTRAREDHRGEVSWAEFEAAAPAQASSVRALFREFEVIVLGTFRSDGFPRLSPVAPLIFDDDLVIATLATDRKSVDLRRDPRCGVHTAVPAALTIKQRWLATAVAIEIEDDTSLEAALAVAARPEIRWAPTAAFRLRLRAASLLGSGPNRKIDTWTASGIEGSQWRSQQGMQ
jgi:hypothetical protein